MSDLKVSEMVGCPFCGMRDHLFIEPDERGSGGQWVSPIYAGCSQITGCGVSRSGDDTDEAIALWNTRVPDASLTLEVAQLKQALEKIVAPYDRDGCMMGERYADAVWIAKAALKESPHVR